MFVLLVITPDFVKGFLFIKRKCYSPRNNRVFATDHQMNRDMLGEKKSSVSNDEKNFGLMVDLRVLRYELNAIRKN